MSSLEDFFAKKDKKKKGKSKQNYVTSELLAKTKEEQSTPVQPVEQENRVKIDPAAAPTQEDEWKEEEEIVKDFEGLRVQKLDKEKGESMERPPLVTEEHENVAGGEEGMKEGSPWQTVTSSVPDTPPPEEDLDPEPEPEPIPDKLPNVHKDVYVPPGARGGGAGGGAYVPPHLKRGGATGSGGGGGGSGAYVPPGARRGGMGGSRVNKQPPDIKSNVAFPSLHDVSKKGEGSSQEKGGDFKEAQGPKTSRSSDANYRAPGLELTNKFSGLEDDD